MESPERSFLNMLNLAKKVLVSNFKRLERPYKLTLAATGRCNARCITCHAWKRPARNELGLHELESFFKKNSYFSWIDLTGGEIFLREDLFDIVNLISLNCRNLQFFHFPTNGFLTHRIIKDVQRLKSLNLKRVVITVSIDGPPKTHNFLKGVDDAWNRSAETFLSLKKIKGIEVYLGMTLSRHNFNQINQTLSELKKVYPTINHRDLHINIAHSSKHFYFTDKDEMPDSDKLNRELEKFVKSKGFSLKPILLMEYIYLKKVKEYLENERMPFKCKALSASVFIGPEGDIYPCTIYSRKISNLREIDYDLTKIWQNRRSLEACKDIREEKCPGCWTPCEAYQSILGNILNFYG